MGRIGSYEVDEAKREAERCSGCRERYESAGGGVD